MPELGVIYILLSAVFYGLAGAVTRRGMLHTSAFNGIFISVLASLPLFVAAAAISGQLGRPTALTLAAYFGLVGIGVLNYGLARYSTFRSIKILGSNRSTPLRALTPITAVVLGIVLLGETLTLTQSAGVAVLIGAPLLLVFGSRAGRASRGSTVGAQAASYGTGGTKLAEGVFFGMLAGVAYGVSQFLIRLVLADTDMGIMGALVTNASAGLFLMGMLSVPGRVDEVRSVHRGGMRWFLLSGVVVFLALIFRFTALESLEVSIASPLHETSMMFGLFFSYLINRDVESFRPMVLVAIALSFVGTIAVAL